MGDRSRTGELGFKVKIDSCLEQLTQSCIEALEFIGIPHQRRCTHRRRFQAVHALDCQDAQCAVRGNFQDDIRGVVLFHGFHRRHEVHRLANIGPPIRGIEPLRCLPGDGRYKWHVELELAVVQECQVRMHGRVDVVHGARVKRNIAGKQAVLQISLAESFDDRFECQLRSANDQIHR